MQTCPQWTNWITFPDNFGMIPNVFDIFRSMASADSQVNFKLCAFVTCVIIPKSCVTLHTTIWIGRNAVGIVCALIDGPHRITLNLHVNPPVQRAKTYHHRLPINCFFDHFTRRLLEIRVHSNPGYMVHMWVTSRLQVFVIDNGLRHMQLNNRYALDDHRWHYLNFVPRNLSQHRTNKFTNIHDTFLVQCNLINVNYCWLICSKLTEI